MDKDAAWDSTTLGQLLVTESSPLLRQRLPALKALRRRRNTLNSPLVVIVRVQHIHGLVLNTQLLLQVEQMLLPGARLIKDQDLSRRMNIHTLIQRAHHQISGRQPRQTQVPNSIREILTCHSNSLQELFIDINILLVPPGVQSCDTLREGSTDTVLGLDVSGVLRDTVVATVKGLDKVLIDLLVEELDLGVRLFQAQDCCNDLFSEMPVFIVELDKNC